ncbi:MAG: TIGR00645 family protein [Zoogloeaceae bacterium]|jgi:uncharacterized protein (TIGR00645 family)|nr:TIGR00645 family protein [Zoogloeaceae bacterium]
MKPLESIESVIEKTIFWSRWLQAPMYVGLIVALGVYVYQFMLELIHLVSGAGTWSENAVMLSVLALIDVVMIANLLIMVIVGGYETFVSRLNLEKHPDQPEWLSHVNASVLKVKLSTAIVTISSIHLLRTFINAEQMTPKTITTQVVIHMVFIVSAIAMAYTDKVMNQALHVSKGNH